MNHRSLLDRLFTLCLGFFVACVLIYAGVQLLQAVFGWVLALGAVVGAGALLTALFRRQRERW